MAPGPTAPWCEIPATFQWGEDGSTFPWPKRLGYELRWFLWLKWWYAIENLAGWLYWKGHDWIHRDCGRRL